MSEIEFNFQLKPPDIDWLDPDLTYELCDECEGTANFCLTCLDEGLVPHEHRKDWSTIPKKSEPTKAEKNLEVAVSALSQIADTEQGSHAETVITSVTRAAQVAQAALDQIEDDDG